jgi:hypothetical protein
MELVGGQNVWIYAETEDFGTLLKEQNTFVAGETDRLCFLRMAQTAP